MGNRETDQQLVERAQQGDNRAFDLLVRKYQHKILGLISRYVTMLDPVARGLTVSVFIQVRLEKQVEAALETFERAIAARPEVMECYLMTGDSDYLISVVVRDVQALERFIVDFLSRVPGVGNIQSSFALKQVKYKTALPLPQEAPLRAPSSASSRSRRPLRGGR